MHPYALSRLEMYGSERSLSSLKSSSSRKEKRLSISYNKENNQLRETFSQIFLKLTLREKDSENKISFMDKIKYYLCFNEIDSTSVSGSNYILT